MKSQEIRENTTENIERILMGLSELCYKGPSGHRFFETQLEDFEVPL